jgi:hypothetical protein
LLDGKTRNRTVSLPEHFFRVKITKGSKLLRYEQELKAILQIRDETHLNELIGYSRNLFQDCLTFIKIQTTASSLTIKLEFAKNQNDLNVIQKRIAEFAHEGEKPKYPSRALALWSDSGATVFVNFSYFYGLLRNRDCQTFIITLTDNYLHELVHCFYKSLIEQEVHDIQCELLEKFLGVTLPLEAKAVKSSEFYR